MMRICDSCGARNDISNDYCEFCGEPLVKDPDESRRGSGEGSSLIPILLVMIVIAFFIIAGALAFL